MPTPPEVLELVDRFNRNADTYRPVGYNEATLRHQFLNPFFKALGWDVHNEQGTADAHKDVLHEEAIKVGGAAEAPDYCFRFGCVSKFFVEAKKPAVNIKEDVSPAYQLRRYAWSAKLPLSILSDFEELAVYDCRIKPAATDSAATGRILLLTCQEYVERWDEIASIFSREAVRTGSFDKYAETTRGKKGTAEVNAAFLKDIETWRDELARNLALRNPRLTQRELNFAVQRTIDRIIFLRIAEDRGIEDYNRLVALTNGERVYARLCEVFERADERYNSGLFHFHKERDRAEQPDELTLRLKINDDKLREIIHSLYYPKSPYEFSVLPADILGQVYEQFLGKVIRLTAAHQAKVEDKPEVKKAGGVYYTPTYIVDYIVRHTVGKLLEGKTPRQAAKLRVLDPACGSGSFLIGAYQFLLDWHRDQYEQAGPAKHTKELYQGPGGVWRLTTAERKRILLANIYGVDIDVQAVETTKLSLLLKVLEGENRDTLERQRRILHQRALPDLGNNIKCGNSLIGPNFFDGQQISLYDEEKRLRVNSFDWRAEFAEVMKAGGFDAVIGNPPWGAEFTEPELAYFRRHYQRVISRMIDSYIYFLDRAVQLARDNCPVGFIIPSTLLNQVDAKPIRELLLKRGLSALVNLGQGIFGSKVLNTSTIVIMAIRNGPASFLLQDVSHEPLLDRKGKLETQRATSFKKWSQLVKRDPDQTFFTGGTDAVALLGRLRREQVPLTSIIRGSIQRGVSPDVVGAHVVSPAEARSKKLERELLRPSVSGPQIKRYHPWSPDQFIVYTGRTTDIVEFPNVLKHLKKFKHENTCKEVTARKHHWWALHRPRDPSIFDSPKFVGLTTSKTIELIYDADESVFVTDAMYVFTLLPGVDPYAAMAILQSTMFLFLYRVANQGEARVIPQVKASKLQTLPFPRRDQAQKSWTTVAHCAHDMLQLERQLSLTNTAHERTALERQISATDHQIDKLVNDLYGLTEEEIAIVEAATTSRTTAAD